MSSFAQRAADLFKRRRNAAESSGVKFCASPASEAGRVVCPDHKMAPPDARFVLTDGRELSCLADLRLALTDMSRETFDHHTKDHGNDFAAWIRDALNEPSCATVVENALTRSELRRVLERHSTLKRR